MKIAIAGAGAMGGRFGYMLQKSGQEVYYIDGWQENVDKINQDGFLIEEDGKENKVIAKAYHTKQIEAEVADIVILFVKSMQLPEILQDLKGIIGKHTRVVCLLNGLGHVNTIEQYLPKENIFVGVTLWTARLLGAGRVHLSGNGGIELQNIGAGKEADAEEIVEIFNNAGLNAKYSENVIQSIWIKACVNGAMNAVCAILDCNLMQFGTVPDGDRFIRNILSEFAWAAKAEDNVDLDVDKVFSIVKGSLDPEKQGKHYPSMHQDLIQHHRKTEVDFLNGYVWQLGEKKGVPTPYCEMITILTHGKETILGIR